MILFFALFCLFVSSVVKVLQLFCSYLILHTYNFVSACENSDLLIKILLNYKIRIFLHKIYININLISMSLKYFNNKIFHLETFY